MHRHVSGACVLATAYSIKEIEDLRPQFALQQARTDCGPRHVPLRAVCPYCKEHRLCDLMGYSCDHGKQLENLVVKVVPTDRDAAYHGRHLSFGN